MDLTAFDTNPFIDGDLVEFLAGGPLMRVLSATDERCVCYWVSNDGQEQQHTFNWRALLLIETAVVALH